MMHLLAVEEVAVFEAAAFMGEACIVPTSEAGLSMPDGTPMYPVQSPARR
jgi:hypothetical protein